MKDSSLFLILVLLPYVSAVTSPLKLREEVLRDSTIRYGKSIEAYLMKVSPGGKIISGRNYSPDINAFLKHNKYVKFPPYPLTIGLDTTSAETSKHHLILTSGNRLYFPKGSKLICPLDLKTNGNMIYAATGVHDVFIDGVNITGSKANLNYITSQWGAGIALYAPSNVIITNASITKSSGDGIDIRTNWGKQTENIVIKGLKVYDATRVGMLITGVINGSFRDIYIEGTGEKEKSRVQKPQTGLSFEPNDCTSKYVNCKFYNLETKNNLGPVLATTNFYNIYVKNTCGVNKIDVVIDKWKDYNDDPACYGASLDVASGSMEQYDTKDLSGTFKIINPTISRNTKRDNYDYYFFNGQGEKSKGGVKYSLTNVKLIHRGTAYTSSNKNKNKEILAIINSGNMSNKVSIK